MLYFLQGNDDYLIQNSLTDIRERYNISVDQQVIFSALDTSFSEVVLELLSDDLFNPQKLLVLKELEQVSDLANYLITTSNMSEANNILVIIFKRNESLSKTLEKTLSAILSIATRINTANQQAAQIAKIVQKKLTTYKHNLKANEITSLIEKYQNNTTLIINEIERVALEKGVEEVIVFADFTNDSSFIESQVFDLISDLEGQRFEQVMEKCDNLLLHQQNVFGLIALLLKNYKEMYQIKSLSNLGVLENKIAERLEIHPYRTKLLNRTAKNISDSNFNKIIEIIIKTEIALKTGTNQQIAIKSLFLKLIDFSD
jgi:DNA polymerase III, delta subunit